MCVLATVCCAPAGPGTQEAARRPSPPAFGDVADDRRACQQPPLPRRSAVALHGGTGAAAPPRRYCRRRLFSFLELGQPNPQARRQQQPGTRSSSDISPSSATSRPRSAAHMASLRAGARYLAGGSSATAPPHACSRPHRLHFRELHGGGRVAEESACCTHTRTTIARCASSAHCNGLLARPGRVMAHTPSVAGGLPACCTRATCRLCRRTPARACRPLRLSRTQRHRCRRDGCGGDAALRQQGLVLLHSCCSSGALVAFACRELQIQMDCSSVACYARRRGPKAPHVSVSVVGGSLSHMHTHTPHLCLCGGGVCGPWSF